MWALSNYANVKRSKHYVLWKAVLDVPCNLQRVVIILQRVVGYTVRPQRPFIYVPVITGKQKIIRCKRNARLMLVLLTYLFGYVFLYYYIYSR